MLLFRHSFLELIGKELKIDSSEMFLFGLFSLIDAMLDRNMEEILSVLPLSEKINAALINRAGELFI